MGEFCRLSYKDWPGFNRPILNLANSLLGNSAEDEIRDGNGSGLRTLCALRSAIHASAAVESSIECSQSKDFAPPSL